MRFGIVAAAAAALFTTAPASAAVALRGYGTLSQDFIRIGSPAAAFPVLQNGAYYLLFGPSYDANPTSDFSIDDIIPFAEAPIEVLPSYNVRYSAALDRITVFGSAGGENLADTENDVLLIIDNAFAPLPTVSLFQVSLASASGGFWQAQSNLPAIPEPATWALMLAGFGLAGGALRRPGRNRRMNGRSAPA